MLKISKTDNRLKEKGKEDIKKIRTELKKDPIVLKMFKKYKVDISKIDNVPISFDSDIDVSAKTVDGEIFLNSDMLYDDYKEYIHYVVHELTHVLQHITGKCNNGLNSDIEYLDIPSEIEAFKEQLKFKEKTDSKKEIGKYLKKLFDRHDLNRKERKKKIKELL